MAMISLYAWVKLFTIFAYFLLEILYAQYLFACLRMNLIEMNATGGSLLIPGLFRSHLHDKKILRGTWQLLEFSLAG